VTLIGETVTALARPSEDARRQVLDGPITPEAFETAFAAFPALHAMELRSPPATHDAPLDRPARIAFWNAERLKHREPSIDLLRRADADILLLAECDLGMARSGNRHTIEDLALALNAGFVFGAEFVELGLGDARERAWHAGELNAAGLHGGAIVSAHALALPALVRLERSGRWFDGGFGERRVGGRIAMMAVAPILGREVLLVATHYESHTGPEDRLAQTLTLIEAIETHAPGLPVLIGGDFNTNTFAVGKAKRREISGDALEADPRRLVEPMAYEPMFEALAAAGFDWRACNIAGAATQRTRPDGTPAPPFGKIDWFFARGLDCSAPAILPAVDGAGVAISDHELIAVTIRPA
jgi:endonuclease/exonuclease/phosphatase family metal-dependent hydrolase